MGIRNKYYQRRNVLHKQTIVSLVGDKKNERAGSNSGSSFLFRFSNIKYIRLSLSKPGLYKTDQQQDGQPP